MHLIIALKHRKSQIYYDMPCLNLNMKYEVSQSNNRSYFSKISTEMWNHEQILESSLVVIGYFCGRRAHRGTAPGPYQQGLNACCIFLIPPTLGTWAQGRQARAGRVMLHGRGRKWKESHDLQGSTVGDCTSVPAWRIDMHKRESELPPKTDKGTTRKKRGVTKKKQEWRVTTRNECK